jgi:predicted signal transduction protein with EAL and GGDEF domain
MATVPVDAEDSRELIVVADKAMYRDKQARKRRIAESTPPQPELV